MGFHTFDVEKAGRLEDDARRYQSVSREELVGALELTGTETVADLGSGTGFYTDVVAPYAERVYAVDIQPEMHDFYREKGVPEGVDLVTSGIDELPFDDAALDGAFSTMTYHEFASDDALAELARVTRPGGRLVIFDWSADGDGERGPPVDERYAVSEAAAALEDAGFEIVTEGTRPEAFAVVAVRAE
jgi:ubiquinone/menaquinone biosynthesis C-methylase UbiE